MINTGYPVILVIAEGGTAPKTNAAPVSDYDHIGTSSGDGQVTPDGVPEERTKLFGRRQCWKSLAR
jgi:hypothetical protein